MQVNYVGTCSWSWKQQMNLNNQNTKKEVASCAHPLLRHLKLIFLLISQISALFFPTEGVVILCGQQNEEVAFGKVFVG